MAQHASGVADHGLELIATDRVEIVAQQRCMAALHEAAGNAKGSCVPPLSGLWPAWVRSCGPSSSVKLLAEPGPSEYAAQVLRFLRTR